MRLLQVPTGSGEVIALHPAVSMVTGLTAEQRQALIDVVAGLPAGEARGAGLVEAHDVLFDLDDDVLDLFELGGHPVDPVVGPGAHVGHDADDQPAREPAAPEPTDDGATMGSEALDAARDEVDEARAAVATAAAALEVATTAREDAAAVVAACTGAAHDADGNDGPDEAGHPGSAAGLEAARERLEAAEAAAVAARDAASPAEEADDTTELRRRRDDLEARRSELLGLLTVLDEDPADEVIKLLAELDGADHLPAEHDAAAVALADEIAALVAELDELPAVDPGSPSLDTARQRLDRAREALEEAEAARRDSPSDDAALAVERAHEELLAALDEAERRFRRARAQQRVEAARAAEQAALAELGHNSYTDFLTGSRSTRNDGGAGVDTAAAELAAAEEAVARAEVAAAAEQRRAEVGAQLAGALDRAAAIVGDAARDEPLRVARALRTVVADPPDRRGDLVGALSRAGLALTGAAGDDSDAPTASEDPRSEPEPELDLADLELLARALVDEAQTNAVRRRTALAELADVESALATVEARLAESVATEAASSAAAGSASASRTVLDDDPEVRSAREALRSAEAAAAAAAEQADARAAAQDRLASAVSAELEAIEDQAAARAVLEAAEDALGAAEARLADAEADALAASDDAGTDPTEVPASALPADGADHVTDGPASLGWYVLSRMAAQRAVSYVGGLPLVLDRTLDSLDSVAVREVLGRLEPTTSAVQLIVLTESEGALAWAEEVGPDRAAVVRPGPAAA